MSPPVDAPAECALQEATRESVLAEVLRGRLGGLGPVTVERLAVDLPAAEEEIRIALLRLEGEGVVMQGRFTAAWLEGGAPVEWCERHLLARIHRYTLARLRREIEPVEPRDFMRFLCDWQRVTGSTRASGPEALAAVLSQFEGFEAPASAWESELLPARIHDYSIAWLDDLCTSGRIAWSRLRTANPESAGKAPGSVRATPIVLLSRREATHWIRQAGDDDRGAVSSRAQRLLDVLTSEGASFFADLVDASGLLRTEAEDSLAELVSRGHVHCDSYAGLRALMVPGSKRAAHHRGRRASLFGLRDAGRWTRVAAPTQDQDQQTASVEHIARTLLRRYGVVCWRLLEREAAWLPPWRELVRVLQRFEARGEIRGGRFIAGLSGEQFALPEAIALMRKVRKRGCDGELIGVSALDPLNLAGTVLPGEKVPRIAGARLVLRDGVVVGSLVAGETRVLAGESDPATADAIRQRLHRLPAASLAGSGANPLEPLVEESAGG